MTLKSTLTQSVVKKSPKKTTTASKTRGTKKSISQTELAKKTAKSTSASKSTVKQGKKTTASSALKAPVKPKKAKAPKQKGALTKEQIKELLSFVMQKLDEGKAESILSIDLGGRTSFADYLVIASGTSARHIFGLANNLSTDLKKAGYRVQLSGENGDGNWVVIDAIDIVVHLFTPQTRADYDIEGLWNK